jgi:hypothetical protein
MSKRPLAYGSLTALFGLAMAGSGAANLAGVPEVVANFTRLGFPDWFHLWLGAWKLAGAVVVLAPGLPRLKEWAHAGFAIAMTSAITAHIAAGDPLGMAAAPAVLLALGLGSWALRPATRRLGDAPPSP